MTRPALLLLACACAVVLLHGLNPNLAHAARATAFLTLKGLFFGSLAACMIIAASRTHPLVRPGLEQLADVVQAVPVVVIGPLIVLLLPLNAVGAALAGLATFQLAYAKLNSALATPQPRIDDYGQLLAATPMQTLLWLRLGTLPVPFVSALRAAIPAALTGAIIGEWSGADRGLGLLMITALQNHQPTLLWQSVFTTAFIAAGLYAIGHRVEHALRKRFQ